jgi:hypothetical protein
LNPNFWWRRLPQTRRGSLAARRLAAPSARPTARTGAASRHVTQAGVASAQRPGSGGAGNGCPGVQVLAACGPAAVQPSYGGAGEPGARSARLPAAHGLSMGTAVRAAMAPGLVGSGTTLPVNGTVAAARARHPRRSGPWPRWHEREPPHGMARAAQQPRRTSTGTRPAAATWARPWRDRSACPAGAGSGHDERGRSSASRCTTPCGRASLGQALAAWLRCIFSSPGIGPTSRSPVSPTTAGPRWCGRCPGARTQCGHGARLQTGAMVASRLARESAQAERIGRASLVQRCLRRSRRRRCGPSVAAPASAERVRNPT